MTYAAALQRGTNPPLPKPTNEFEFIDGESKRLFGASMAEILTKVNAFAPNYKRLSSDKLKADALFQLFVFIALK